MGHSFNLVTESWIPVLTKDHKHETVSLFELFDKAEFYTRVAAENNYVDFAIFLHLQAIVYVACNRDKDLAKVNRNTFIYDKVKPAILRYLDQNKHLFDLYDAEHPFLQLPKSEKNFTNLTKDKVEWVKTCNILGLDITQASDNKENKWRPDAPDDSELDSWIARHLLAYRFIHPRKNGQSPDIDSNFWETLIKPLGNKTVGEYKGSFLPTFYLGENLASSFKLNFFNAWYTRDNCYSDEFTVHPIQPEWESDYSQFDKRVIYDKMKALKKEGKSNDVVKKSFEVQIPLYDIAKLYTYSNVHVYIDRDSKTFYAIYNYPLDVTHFHNLSLLDYIHCIKKPETEYSVQWLDSLMKDEKGCYGILPFPDIQMNNQTSIVHIKERNLLGADLLPIFYANKALYRNREDVFSNILSSFKFSALVDLYGETCYLLQHPNLAKGHFDKANKLKWDKSLRRRDEFANNVSPLLVEFYNTVVMSEYSESEIEKAKIDCIRGLYQVLDKEIEVLFQESTTPYTVYSADDNVLQVFYKNAKNGFKRLFNCLEYKMGKNTFEREVPFKVFKHCVSQVFTDNGKDTLLLKKYRNREDLGLIDLSNVDLSASDKSFYVKNMDAINKAVRDALWLWSSYQKNLWREDEHKYADTKSDSPYYKQSLGYVLWMVYKSRDKEKSFLDKYYSSCSAGINAVLKFFKLCLDKGEIDSPLNFGKLAYLLSEVYVHNSISHLNEDIRSSFLCASMYMGKE